MKTGAGWRQTLFLGLALSQTAHSTEEYLFRLYEVFAPTRVLIGFFSDDPALGFAIGNALVIAFAFWTYWFRIHPGARSAAGWIWGWALVELANGIGHISLAAAARGYFPGVYTAPLLVAFSLALICQALRTQQRTQPG